MKLLLDQVKTAKKTPTGENSQQRFLSPFPLFPAAPSSFGIARARLTEEAPVRKTDITTKCTDYKKCGFFRVFRESSRMSQARIWDPRKQWTISAQMLNLGNSKGHDSMIKHLLFFLMPGVVFAATAQTQSVTAAIAVSKTGAAQPRTVAALGGHRPDRIGRPGFDSSLCRGTFAAGEAGWNRTARHPPSRSRRQKR